MLYLLFPEVIHCSLPTTLLPNYDKYAAGSGRCIYFENVNGRGDWGNLRVDVRIFCTHIVDKYNLKQIKVV